MVPIVQNGDPVLRAHAAPIPEELFGTDELRKMIETLANALDEQTDGVAIAAPQLGISARIFLIRYDRLLQTPHGQELPPADLGVYINPQIVKSSRRREEMDEGCLSVRGLYGKTIRHERATVRARDVEGRTFERGGGGILAQAFQHEIDHLNGILFIDHAVELTETDYPAHEHAQP